MHPPDDYDALTTVFRCFSSANWGYGVFLNFFFGRIYSRFFGFWLFIKLAASHRLHSAFRISHRTGSLPYAKARHGIDTKAFLGIVAVIPYSVLRSANCAIHLSFCSTLQRMAFGMTCFYFGCAFARHLDGSIYLYTAQFHYLFNTPFPCCLWFGRDTWHEYKLSLLCLSFVLFGMENLGSLQGGTRWACPRVYGVH